MGSVTLPLRPLLPCPVRNTDLMAGLGSPVLCSWTGANAASFWARSRSSSTGRVFTGGTSAVQSGGQLDAHCRGFASFAGARSKRRALERASGGQVGRRSARSPTRALSGRGGSLKQRTEHVPRDARGSDRPTAFGRGSATHGERRGGSARAAGARSSDSYTASDSWERSEGRGGGYGERASRGSGRGRGDARGQRRTSDRGGYGAGRQRDEYGGGGGWQERARADRDVGRGRPQNGASYGGTDGGRSGRGSFSGRGRYTSGEGERGRGGWRREKPNVRTPPVFADSPQHDDYDDGGFEEHFDGRSNGASRWHDGPGIRCASDVGCRTCSRTTPAFSYWQSAASLTWCASAATSSGAEQFSKRASKVS